MERKLAMKREITTDTQNGLRKYCMQQRTTNLEASRTDGFPVKLKLSKLICREVKILNRQITIGTL